jgi:hypothetical protein
MRGAKGDKENEEFRDEVLWEEDSSITRWRNGTPASMSQRFADREGVIYLF